MRVIPHDLFGTEPFSGPAPVLLHSLQHVARLVLSHKRLRTQTHYIGLRSAWVCRKAGVNPIRQIDSTQLREEPDKRDALHLIDQAGVVWTPPPSKHFGTSRKREKRSLFDFNHCCDQVETPYYCCDPPTHHPPSHLTCPSILHHNRDCAKQGEEREQDVAYVREKEAERRSAFEAGHTVPTAGGCESRQEGAAAVGEHNITGKERTFQKGEIDYTPTVNARGVKSSTNIRDTAARKPLWLLICFFVPQQKSTAEVSRSAQFVLGACGRALLHLGRRRTSCGQTIIIDVTKHVQQ